MKIIYTLIAIVLFSCSKNKEEIPANSVKVTAVAKVVNNRYWAVDLFTEKLIVSEGTAKVEWDVYSNGQFMYKKSAEIAFKFDGNQLNSPTVITTIQGATSMDGRNENIVSMSGSGGYSFRN